MKRDRPKALDLGTGNGDYLLDLYERGYDPVGVDRSYLGNREVTESVKRRELDYVVSDALEFVRDEDSNSYNLVSIRRPDGLPLSLYIYAAGRTHPKIEQLLKEIHRILIPNGEFEVLLRSKPQAVNSRKSIEYTNLFELEREFTSGRSYNLLYTPR